VAHTHARTHAHTVNGRRAKEDADGELHTAVAVRGRWDGAVEPIEPFDAGSFRRSMWMRAAAMRRFLSYTPIQAVLREPFTTNAGIIKRAPASEWRVPWSHLPVPVSVSHTDRHTHTHTHTVTHTHTHTHTHIHTHSHTYTHTHTHTHTPWLSGVGSALCGGLWAARLSARTGRVVRPPLSSVFSPPSVCLPRSVCLHACLSVSLYVCLSVCLHVPLSVWLSACLPWTLSEHMLLTRTHGRMPTCLLNNHAC
jgi:hypothetical protein